MSQRNSGRNGSPQFCAGASVRLTERYTRALNKNGKSRNVNWAERTGKVLFCNNYDASVLWNGRKSFELLPVGALQLVTEES